MAHAAIHAGEVGPVRDGMDHIGCPRCAYDMAGHIAAWRDSCPLHADCPECGLTFAWRDVLVEDRRRVPWLFEHARRGPFAYLLRSATATAARTVLPGIFWARVGLHHRVVVGRLLQWLALIFIILHAAAGALGFGALYIQVRRFGALEFTWLLNLFTEPVVRFDEGCYRGRRGWTNGIVPEPLEGMDWRITATGCALAWIAMILVIPQTRLRAKVHSLHLLRAIVYSVSWFIVLDLARALEYAWAALHGAIGAPAPPLHLTETLLGPLGAALLFAWSAAWWHAVLSRGWQIPHPTRTWAVLMIPVLLTGAVLWCLVYVTARDGW